MKIRVDTASVWTVGLVCLVAGVGFSVVQSNWVWLVAFLMFAAPFCVRRVSGGSE
ncbi:hypothetical protein [Galactobacter valiniphilus]|uniref:hypothetical protein n=1 Tax=Galactobacter valiniphilus TaxID=2676122 RepID=UPI0037359647